MIFVSPQIITWVLCFLPSDMAVTFIWLSRCTVGVAKLVVHFGWNKVTLRRAQLVLRWVTACGQVTHLGAKPAS